MRHTERVLIHWKNIKENKALIAKERDSLERQLAELEENTPDKIPDDPTPKMLDRVSSVHDILVSDSYSLVQKNEALKQIIDKIVYDRESDTLKIHSFYTTHNAGNPRIYGLSGYFIGCGNLVIQFGH